jgi:hypothetical protein
MSIEYKSGIQCKTRRLGERDYVGFIQVIEDGRYLWSESSGIRRLSRGDALTDAQRMAHDRIARQFEKYA